MVIVVEVAFAGTSARGGSMQDECVRVVLAAHAFRRRGLPSHCGNHTATGEAQCRKIGREHD